MTDPDYAFSIPSIYDDTVLDCRIYHPKQIADIITSEASLLRGAIVAHPYAPLGGCFDDPVVLSVTECLLEQGHVVITFNFRGAGDSKGKTSWTGKPEVDDFCSVVGLLVYYLNNLRLPKEPDVLSPVISTSQPNFDANSPFDDSPAGPPLEVLLAGYSFGSLILSRLPSVPAILRRFETAERGTAASEIFLRANMLAKQMRQSHQEVQIPQSSRGRTLHPPDSPTKSHTRSSPITVGGEETNASDRRRSRDSRHSSDIIREVPHNIKTHIQHRHSGRFHRKSEDVKSMLSGPNVSVRYLMISPVLLPMTTTLLSPGIPFTSGNIPEAESGVLSLSRPTLIIFGSSDTFTASKKLRQWSEKLTKDSAGKLTWSQIDHAGHFWREKGVMKALRKTIVSWLKESQS